MFSQFGTWSVVPMAAGALLGQVVSRYQYKRALIKKRVADLDQAIILTKAHQDAFNEFIEQDVAGSLKETLLFFSEQIATESSAAAFLSYMTNQIKTFNPNEPHRGALADLDALREQWPGKAQLFDRAVMAGLMAALIRWPSVGKIGNNAFACLIVDPQKEVAGVVRAARAPKPDDRQFIGPLPARVHV